MARPYKARVTETSSKTVEIIKDIALTYGREHTPESLAQKHGITKGRVQAIATNLRGYGVDVAKMRRAGLILRALDELKAEAPHIFLNKQTASVVASVKKRGRPTKKK